MKKFGAGMIGLALLAAGAARAEGPVFTGVEYDCLQALGHEIYEDYSRAAIDALPPYLKDALRGALDKSSCNTAGVAQIISRRLDDEDAKYLADFGLSPQRVTVLPAHLNLGLQHVIHDPDIPSSSKKTLIRGLIDREMPRGYAKLTDSDLATLDLTSSEGAVLQRMPPNLLAQLHDILNDPKLEMHNAEKLDRARRLIGDERLTPEDLAYLKSIGHSETYLTNKNELLEGVHFAIADTTLSAAEKKKHVDALMKPQNDSRAAQTSKTRGEHLGELVVLLFPLIAVAGLLGLTRLLAGEKGWEKWKPRLPWIGMGMVLLWTIYLLFMVFSDIFRVFGHSGI